MSRRNLESNQTRLHNLSRLPANATRRREAERLTRRPRLHEFYWQIGTSRSGLRGPVAFHQDHFPWGSSFQQICTWKRQPPQASRATVAAGDCHSSRSPLRMAVSPLASSCTHRHSNKRAHRSTLARATNGMPKESSEHVHRAGECAGVAPTAYDELLPHGRFLRL